MGPGHPRPNSQEFKARAPATSVGMTAEYRGARYQAERFCLASVRASVASLISISFFS